MSKTMDESMRMVRRIVAQWQGRFGALTVAELPHGRAMGTLAQFRN
jgi:hypothetical protein